MTGLGQATNRASSVPVSRQENSRLEPLRSKRQRLSNLDVEDTPPSNLPRVLVSRGRKRESLSCVTSQPDCVTDTPASVTMPIVDASEERPHKRRKRALSIPTAPRSHRRSRSRAASPTIDMVHVTPSRVSTRLARKMHSFISSRSADIYTHLAGSDRAGDLLSPTSSVILSTPNPTVHSQSIQKPRGRRRRVVDLTDENVKKNLIEEWARMRQSQGTLPLSGLDENVFLSQVLARDTSKSGGSVSSVHLESMSRRHSPDPEPIESQGTIPNGFHRGSYSVCMDSENGFAVDGEKIDQLDSALHPGGETEQGIVPSVGIGVLSTSIPDQHVGEGSPSDELTDPPGTTPDHDHPASCPPTCSLSPLREDSVETMLPTSELAGAVSLNNSSMGSHSVTLPQTHSSNIHLDSDEEFYMLDVPEIFTLPWEPVTSHLYVPPSLGKLISGMREQLTIETRARRRAEELYQAELIRRISAEKIIENLRAGLEETQDLFGESIC